MRIVSFSHRGGVCFGALEGDHVRIHPTAASALDLALHAASHPADDALPLPDIKLLAPIPRPGKVICVGLNYRAHAIEGGNPIPDYPAMFMRGATSLVGPQAPMILPECSDKLDFEAELAVVIGRIAMNVRTDPLAYVAGYCCFNDGSVRDYQRKSTQWTAGKNFDMTGALGAVLVTPDEVPDGASGLRISSRLNGELMQDGNTADMIFDVASLIMIVSEAMTLEPGDIIATGTPAGVGYARKPPKFLREGDRIEVEIERIDRVCNLVARREVRQS